MPAQTMLFMHQTNNELPAGLYIILQIAIHYDTAFHGNHFEIDQFYVEITPTNYTRSANFEHFFVSYKMRCACDQAYVRLFYMQIIPL